MHKITWVLDDGRSGNTNQAIALAQALKHPYEVKKVTYNFLRYLPSLFLAKYPIHLSKTTKEDLTKLPAPKYILSAGRKTSIIALYLKNIYKKAKLIQIMRPACSSSQFAAIIVPTHDKYPKSSNVIEVTGSLNNVTTKIKEAKIEFLNYHPDFGRFIGVLIGGNTKNFVMTKADAEILVINLRGLTTIYQLPLFVSFSRRTPEVVKNIIKYQLRSNTIYDPSSGGHNPYLGLIAAAECLVVTSDSISMLSEVAASGKGLYIFKPDSFKSKKHLSFIRYLIEIKIAKMLDKNVNQYKKYSYQPLNEMERIMPLIEKLLV